LTFGAANVTPYVENGFTIDNARLTNGNCLAGACMGLNNTETSTLTKVGGGAFSVSSLWFQFLGTHGVLTLTPSTGSPVSLTQALFGNNDGGQKTALSFTNIPSLMFSVTALGNVRIDDIIAAVGAVGQTGVTPLPGAVWLLGTVLAGGAG